MTASPHPAPSAAASRPSHSASRTSVLLSYLPLLAVVGILMGGFALGHFLAPHEEHAVEGEQVASEVLADPLAVPVELSAAKLQAAQIKTMAAAPQKLAAVKTVPGTVQYDATQLLSMRAPADCVVEQVLVQRGEWVEPGTPLALVNSQEMGTARNEADQLSEAIKIAQLKYDWAEKIDTNICRLIDYLHTTPDVNEVNERFQGEVLGAHRDELVTAYAHFRLSDSLSNRAESLSERGVLTGRTLEERSTDREMAAASFTSHCEQIRFQSRHELELARAELSAAERAAEVAREKVGNLLGPYGAIPESGKRSEFQLVAPRAGRIEELSCGVNSRLESGEVVLELADTRQVWVAAQIHPGEWPALQSAPGTVLQVTVPGVQHEPLPAHVRFAGGKVSPNSLAVPLVADIDNAAGMLRPGLFVWIQVPLGAEREVLAVSTSALQEHDGETFVFTELAPGKFQRRPVTVGTKTPAWTEITAGLASGDTIVSEGAFFLKSELLLEEE